jgi:hypothetical protein
MLRALAGLAGVTSITVSPARRTYPSPVLATRGWLKKTAEGYVYRPDPAVAWLMHYLRKKRSA